MNKLINYFTVNGWKEDFEETRRNVKDISILVRRAVGLSEYGFKDGQEMTSRELKEQIEIATSLIFISREEFKLHAMTHKWPLGPCVIYDGRKRLKYDDSYLDKPIKYKSN